MNVTRIIALGLLVVGFGATGLAAQGMRAFSPPAEIPAATYSEDQYVDSRGCVYTRAGIGGKVEWIARVSRDRQPICGYPPTDAQASARVPAIPERVGAIEQTVMVLEPRAPVVAPRRAPRPVPVRVQAQRPRAVAPAPYRGEIRVVPRHVYDNRRNTTGFKAPAGYAPVWTDDRLNEHRAERTLRPAQRLPIESVPPGYRPAWKDDRLNRKRTVASPAGEAQTDQIWSDTVPRTLVAVPTDRPVVTAKTALTAPVVNSAGSWLRVAAYGDVAGARNAAAVLRRQGMPARLGTVQRNGGSYNVVLVGPFPTRDAARAALPQVRGAGFTQARLN